MWRALRLVALCLLGAHAGLAWCEGGVRIENLSVGSVDQQVQVSAQLAFDLPTQVDDALHRGVPIFFTAEATINLERWYWMDKVVSKSQRFWRLSFQPLTRRYRLQVSNQPIDNTGLGVGLAQNHDTLADAMSALQRIGTWNLGPLAVEPDNKLRLDFKFKLETSPLIKPLLAGANDSEWGLSAQRSVNFKPGSEP